MTAEVAVLNRHAIALATDSAVTIRHGDGDKIFDSVNKLFSLQKTAPVGVMIYGEAEFMRIPWEPLIKVYRAQLKRTCFDTIEQYADSLLEFVRKHPLTNEATRQEDTFRARVTQFYITIGRDIREAAELVISAGMDSKLSSAELKQLAREAARDTIQYHERVIAKHDAIATFPKEFASKRRQMIVDIRRNVLREFRISALTRSQERHIDNLFERAMQSTFFTGSTGVVVAGYGESEMFPALVSLRLDGVYGDQLRHTRERKAIDGETSALLKPFAQQEVVATFMNGVDPQFSSDLEFTLLSSMDGLFETVANKIKDIDRKQTAQLKRALTTASREIVETFRRHVDGFIKRNHTPIIEVLEYMPKEEIAGLAESLVHLTSTRRRVAMEAETVGGPIDVAVITKGDGFIWLKRKHYFRPELNPQFFARMLEGKS